MTEIGREIVIYSDGCYQFDLSDFHGECKIYAKASPGGVEQFIMKTENPWVQITMPLGRWFFTIEASDGRKMNTATRLVELNEIGNFRDMGGYTNKDGKVLKYGYFYRSATLSGLSKEAMDFLEKLGLKTIFDFRSKAEVMADSDPLIPGSEYINHSGIVTMDSDFNTQNFDMKTLFEQLAKNKQAILGLGDFMVNGYRTMAREPEAFRCFFDRMKETPNQPILFHCASGKDRTGICGALLMRILDFPKEIIEMDYLRSNQHISMRDQNILKLLHEKIEDEDVRRILSEIFSVRTGYINTFWEEAEKQYDHFDYFLEKRMNITEKDRENFKALYLE